MSLLLEDLNPPQREAVQHRDGPLLVLAGAGSGKTRVITYRVAYLIEQGVLPQQIFAVTFTNKAAQEMSERVAGLLGVSTNPVWMATIHSSCSRILRRDIDLLNLGITKDFMIADAGDQQSVLRRCMKELNLDRDLKVSIYQGLFSRAKNSWPALIDWTRHTENEDLKLEKMWELYHRFLAESNCLDFDDLLVNTYELFDKFPEVLGRYQRRWRYQMVDEFQDTNTIQFQIVKQLAAANRNLCVVGDDDQLIYKWRGAQVENILNFEKEFPGTKVIVLDQNYRSTKTILQAASSVSALISRRKEKELWTNNKTGNKITVYEALDEYDEAHYCARTVKELCLHDRFHWNDFAILYRTNAQSRIFEEVFTQKQIPYYLVGEIGFYKRREVRDLMAYLMLIAEPRHREAFHRVINVPARNIGEKTLEKIESFASDRGLFLIDTIGNESFLNDCTPKIRQALKEFVGILDYAGGVLREEGLGKSLQWIIDSISYLNWLKKGDLIHAESRIENVGQLINAVINFEHSNPGMEPIAGLRTFLENVSLASESDDYDSKSDRLALMTLHCAKGLEFPVVILAGMVDGLIPHARALKDSEEFEDEERRLCYVGITRARNLLYLTCPMNRQQFGNKIESQSSRFIKDIPKELLTREENPEIARRFRSSPEWEQQNRALHYPHQPRQTGRRFPINQPAKPKPTPQGGTSSTGKSSTDQKVGFRLGTRVRHPRYGVGMVISVAGSGERVKLTISFPGFGQKLILAHIAPLEIIEF